MNIQDLDRYLSPIFWDLELNAIRTEHGIPGEVDVNSDQGVLYRDRMLYQVREAIKGCTACPLHHKRNLAVPCDFVSSIDSGGKFPSLMVVGEGPGYTEDHTGLPLAGIYELLASNAIFSINYEQVFAYQLGLQNNRVKYDPNYTCIDAGLEDSDPLVIDRLHPHVREIKTAGQLLDNILHKAGRFRTPWAVLLNRLGKYDKVQLVDTAVANIVCCASFEVEEVNGIPVRKNVPPPADSCAACRRFLIAEIALIQPKHLLLLGASALDAFYPGKSLKECIALGQMDPPEDIADVVDKVSVYYHPASIMRTKRGEDPSLYDKMSNRLLDIVKETQHER